MSQKEQLEASQVAFTNAAYTGLFLINQIDTILGHMASMWGTLRIITKKLGVLDTYNIYSLIRALK